MRAVARYQQVDGRRLAAAVTLYGFFAAFALALLGFAVLGFVLDEPAVDRSVQRFLDQHLPRMDTGGLREARSAAGLIALVSLPVFGLLWVDALRSSVRAMWQVEQYPGRLLLRWLIDLLALIGLGVLLAVSLTLAFGAEAMLGWLLRQPGGEEGLAMGRWLLAAVRFVLGLAVNTLLSIAVLTLVPRLRMPLRRVLPPALLITGGLELLTSAGRLVVGRAETNPAFQVVAGAAGLLLFLLLLNQLILFAAALSATGNAGRAADLATGQPVPAQHLPARSRGAQSAGAPDRVPRPRRSLRGPADPSVR